MLHIKRILQAIVIGFSMATFLATLKPSADPIITSSLTTPDDFYVNPADLGYKVIDPGQFYDPLVPAGYSTVWVGTIEIPSINVSTNLYQGLTDSDNQRIVDNSKSAAFCWLIWIPQYMRIVADHYNQDNFGFIRKMQPGMTATITTPIGTTAYVCYAKAMKVDPTTFTLPDGKLFTEEFYQKNMVALQTCNGRVNGRKMNTYVCLAPIAFSPSENVVIPTPDLSKIDLTTPDDFYVDPASLGCTLDDSGTFYDPEIPAGEEKVYYGVMLIPDIDIGINLYTGINQAVDQHIVDHRHSAAIFRLTGTPSDSRFIGDHNHDENFYKIKNLLPGQKVKIINPGGISREYVVYAKLLNIEPATKKLPNGVKFTDAFAVTGMAVLHTCNDPKEDGTKTMSYVCLAPLKTHTS